MYQVLRGKCVKINNKYIVKIQYNNETYEKNFFSGEIGKEVNTNYEMPSELLKFFYYNYVFDGKINLYVEISNLKYDVNILVKAIKDLCSYTKKNIINISFILKNYLYYKHIEKIINVIEENINIKVNALTLEVNISNLNEYEEIKNKQKFTTIKALISINDLDEILKFDIAVDNVKKVFLISSKNLILSLKKLKNYYLLKNNIIQLSDNENEVSLLNFLLERNDRKLKLLQENKFAYNICKYVKFNTYYINSFGKILKCDKSDSEEIVVGSILNGHFELDFHKISKLIILNDEKCAHCYFFPTCFNKHCLLEKKLQCPNAKIFFDERIKIN